MGESSIIKNRWLRDSMKVMRGLGYEQSVWEDFLRWAVYQSGWDTNKPYEIHCSDENTERQYKCLYMIIKKAIQDDPHRNILLELMVALGLAGPCDVVYDENTAEKILLAAVDHEIAKSGAGSEYDYDVSCPAAWDVKAPDNFDKYLRLWGVENIIIHDADCDENKGSKLIALGNVILSTYASGAADRAVLISSSDMDQASSAAMMAFIQLSIMGISSYVLMDKQYRVNNTRKMALFAPPNAVCTKSFFSECWDESRMAAIVWGMTYGDH